MLAEHDGMSCSSSFIAWLRKSVAEWTVYGTTVVQ